MSALRTYRKLSLLPGIALIAIGISLGLVDMLTPKPSLVTTFAIPHVALQPGSALPALPQPAPAVVLPAPDLADLEQKALVEYLAQTYKQPEPLVQRIVRSAYQEANQHDLSPLLILAIVMKESSLRPDARSSYGALGLMQVVPRFHKDKLPKSKKPADVLLRPEDNIRVGASILAEYLDWKKGSLSAALVKYSGNARGYVQKVKSYEAELEQVRAQGILSAHLS